MGRKRVTLVTIRILGNIQNTAFFRQGICVKIEASLSLSSDAIVGDYLFSWFTLIYPLIRAQSTREKPVPL